MRKYRLLRERLGSGGLFFFEPAPLASRADIELVHDPDYVEAFLAGSLDAAAMRRIGFPWSGELVRRTLASAGGTLAATAEALRTGRGGTLAGGTHHAFRGYGSGYCVFNDLAIAARWLLLRAAVRRVAIVDLDVHQGDGTAALFRDDPAVLTVSLHGRNNFPFRKQESAIDLEFADGTGDEEYLEGLASVLPRVAVFGPEFVFYQSGVDGLAEDRLGRLALTGRGLATRDEMVFALVRRMGIPVVVTMGGGYATPIECTVEAHWRTYMALGGLGDGDGVRFVG